MASTSAAEQVHSSLYNPKGNGYIENIYSFLKTCINSLTWDKVAHIACATDYFVTNEHSKESALFLGFGRDVDTPIMQLPNSNIRYRGDQQSFLILDALRNMYMVLSIILNFE